MKVRDVIRLIEKDDWRLVRTRCSHRQFNHPVKRGVVTVPGKPNDELAPGTVNNILKQAGLEVKYLIVIEPTSTGFSAYSPDLPGCATTGATREECEANMHEAIEFHLEGLRLEGEPIPQPGSSAAIVEIA
jgi:predicted RNA binding protein YcfA (HicA-like mRNA interferase family)/predicted RNase H-like HicB family nuclease